MPAVLRRRKFAADRAGSLSNPLRRQEPTTIATLDVAYFYSRPEGQFNSLSHAFVCTEDATLAIGSTECDEDPDKVQRNSAAYNDMIVFDNFLDTKSVFLTGNTTTIYALALADLSKDGPVVLEVPPGPTAGMVDDFWFRSITEVGRTGPDAGKGGKFLLVSPGYKGELPKEGYFIVMATMNNNNILVRGLVQNGDVAAALSR
ncbi:MAG: DUF1254 domain-containing protein [Methylocella sp.]